MPFTRLEISSNELILSFLEEFQKQYLDWNEQKPSEVKHGLAVAKMTFPVVRQETGGRVPDFDFELFVLLLKRAITQDVSDPMPNQWTNEVEQEIRHALSRVSAQIFALARKVEVGFEIG